MKRMFLKSPEIYLTRIISAWCAAEIFLVLRNRSFGLLSFAENLNLLLLASLSAFALTLIFVLDFIFPKAKIDSYSFAICTLGFLTVLAFRFIGNTVMYFFIPLLIAAAVIICYLLYRNRMPLTKARFGNRTTLTVAIILSIAFAIYIGMMSACRYMCYATPNFDFGIFCQMFYNMKETGAPITTCERDMLLSHFSVHISPIYYLLLPVYCIFPSPVTLQVEQAVVVASAIIPLWLITKKYSLSGRSTVLVLVMFAFYPAISGGCMYDLHENCFLPALLLWMFWFFESKKWVGFYIFVFLTLLVKEDAFVFVAVFALYILISRKCFLHGGIALIMALAYFGFAVIMLKTYGLGIMSNRYSNYIYDDSGLFGVLKTLIKNPGYLFTQIFTTTDNTPAKIFYVLQLLACVGFIPLITSKPSRFMLILPIFVNLITNYPYQYDITFQYSFAISAFLIYMTVMNLADMNPRVKKFTVPFGAIAAILGFCVFISPAGDSIGRYYSNVAYYNELDEIMESIPQDASVSASSFFVPHLANRAELYEEFYHKDGDTDYIVLDIRPGYSDEGIKACEKYLLRGYTILEEYDEKAIILVCNK